MSGLEPTCDGGNDCIMHALYFVFTRVNLLSIFVLFVLFVCVARAMEHLP